MKEFIDRWQNEPKFKTKIQLLLYTAFVVIVSIFAIAGSNNNIDNSILDDFPNDAAETTTNNQIEIPEKYNYIINITINDEQYKYTGIKERDKETITKESNENITNYKYESNAYYVESNGSYLLTTKEKVYDIIDENYININTINTYLSKANQENNQYIIYLKDIILGNNSNEYITITKDNNLLTIDYTNLIKTFDKEVNTYIVKYEIVK